MPTRSAAADSDPLKAVADAMDAAVQAGKDGAERVRLGASDAMPAIGRFLSSAVYHTSYTVSYGLVFPAAMVARVIPKDNAVVHGLVDGARAAADALRGSSAPASAVEPET